MFTPVSLRLSIFAVTYDTDLYPINSITLVNNIGHSEELATRTR